MMLSEERREWKAPSIFVGGTPFTAKSGNIVIAQRSP